MRIGLKPLFKFLSQPLRKRAFGLEENRVLSRPHGWSRNDHDEPGSHAVFAVDEPNGTHILTVIPWDSIGVVVIRGARALPKEMEE